MIVRHLATACLVYVSLVLQSCMAGDIAIHSCRPWFPGVVLASCVLMHNEVAGVVWAGVLGLALDGLAAERLGVHLIMTTFVATGLLMTRQDIRTNGTVLLGVFVFVGTLLWRFASMTIHATLADREMDFQDHLSVAFGDSLYSSVLTVVGVLMFCVFRQMLGRRKTLTSIDLRNRWTMLTR